ncbi:anti-sigma factor [Streptomyces sp. NPDC001070]
MNTPDVHTLSGAYALDALPEPQASAFRAHLRQCQTCTTEVREFRETAARLALAAAVVPPASLRGRIMVALPQIRQVPPVGEGNSSVFPLHRRRSMSYLAAAACLAIAVVLGGWVLSLERSIDVQRTRAARAEQRAATLAAVLADPQAAFHSAKVTGGGTATIVTSPGQHQAALLYDRLPDLSGDQVYQLWYSVGGTMTSAGLLHPDGSAGSILLPQAPEGAEAVGVTTEPPGGSTAPTTRPVVLLRI